MSAMTQQSAGGGLSPETVEAIGSGRTTVLDMFRHFLQADPHELAVLDDTGRRWSRAELDEESDHLAELLRSEGAGPAGPVIICLPNRIEWMAGYLAVLKAGAVAGTIPVTLDATSIADALRQLGSGIALLPRAHRGRDFDAELTRVNELLGTRVTGILFDVESGAATVASRDGAPVSPVPLPEGTAHVLFSSSTTGASKAIAHSDASMAAYNLGVMERYGVRSPGAIYMPSPLGHSTGAWHGARMSLLTGCRLVLQDRWDAEVALRLVEENGAQITVAATPFLKDLVEAPWDGPGQKLRSLHTFLCGGAQVPPALLDQAKREFPATFVGNIWAMSEGGATSSTPDDSRDQLLSTCGTPLPGVLLRTIDVDGDPTPPGVEGELVMRTPSQCLGYVGRQDMFEASFTDDGYFRTGDLAVLDGDGYMSITGRLKDLIIRGGINIAPVPIENALSDHPAIAGVAVVGKPDPRLGERICAVVVLAEGRDLGLNELIDWLVSRDLPRRLWPEHVMFVDHLPVTPAGKVRKAVLVEDLFGE